MLPISVNGYGQRNESRGAICAQPLPIERWEELYFAMTPARADTWRSRKPAVFEVHKPGLTSRFACSRPARLSVCPMLQQTYQRSTSTNN